MIFLGQLISSLILSTENLFPGQRKRGNYEERTGLSRLSPRVKDELDYVIRLRDQQFDLAVRNIQRELDKQIETFWNHGISNIL